jgi:hypothetical protein
MNKFVKRILKTSKTRRNALLIGPVFEVYRDLLDFLSTMFVVGGEPPPVKAKNLVFREDLHGVNELPDIDFIFIHYTRSVDIPKLQISILKNHPVIFVYGSEEWHRDEFKFLIGLGYTLIDLQPTLQRWIPKR